MYVCVCTEKERRRRKNESILSVSATSSITINVYYMRHYARIETRRVALYDRLKIEMSGGGGRPPFSTMASRAYARPVRQVSRFFSRGKASSEAREGNAPRHPTNPSGREPRNGTRSPPSRVTAMKSFVIAPLASLAAPNPTSATK